MRRVGYPTDTESTCLLNGKRHYGKLPSNAIFVGMEKEPNQKPRYGKLHHPWYNLPCYETKKEVHSEQNGPEKNAGEDN